MEWIVTPRRALELGCDRHARMFDLIPGYAGEDTGDGLTFVPVSDLLWPLIDLLTTIWVTMRELRGEDPDFSFRVGKPIQTEDGARS